MKYRAVTGMNDILPEEAKRFARVERIFRETVETYGFGELRTPLVEDLGLFHKSTGETSEVVQKQMFLLQRERETLALRPEGTPSAARVYINNKMQAREPVTKWYYIGPMFRAERPQRGRYRQFHQAGCELYGDTGPVCDAEMIDMLYRMCIKFGLTSVRVDLNTLGSPEARTTYRERLLAHFEPLKASLSEHAKERLTDNPLRILDSKNPEDQAACENAPLLLDCLTEEDRIHFDGLKSALETLGTPFTVAPRLVRGLDYYTRTCFEIVAESGEIGSQSAILGGGRYDGMLEGLGGPSTPAIGFAMGLERILLALGDETLESTPLVFIAPLGALAVNIGLSIAQDLRQKGIWVELDSRGNSLKSMLRRANGQGARLCLVIGEQEASSGTVQLKDLMGHSQDSVPLDQVTSAVARLLEAAKGPSEEPA